MIKRINIALPEETVAVLDRVAPKGGRSTFIDRAILHYVVTQGRTNLRKQLASGYWASAAEDVAMAAEWFPLEEGAHARVSAKPPRKATEKTKRK